MSLLSLIRNSKNVYFCTEHFQGKSKDYGYGNKPIAHP